MGACADGEVGARGGLGGGGVVEEAEDGAAWSEGLVVAGCEPVGAAFLFGDLESGAWMGKFCV